MNIKHNKSIMALILLGYYFSVYNGTLFLVNSSVPQYYGKSVMRVGEPKLGVSQNTYWLNGISSE